MTVLSLESRQATVFSHMHEPRTASTDPWLQLEPRQGDEVSSWRSVIEHLQSMKRLPDDWDGEGTAPPDSALIDYAIGLAHRLQANRYRPPD